MFDRRLRRSLEMQIAKPFVHVLFGARQTGKSTLLNGLLPQASQRINLADPEERTRFLAESGYAFANSEFNESAASSILILTPSLKLKGVISRRH